MLLLLLFLKVSDVEQSRIQECEEVLLGEIRWRAHRLRPPSPGRLLVWAKDHDSDLPHDTEVKLKGREVHIAEKRVVEMQRSIEEDDREVLGMEAMLRPLIRQVPLMNEAVEEYRKKLKKVEIYHNTRRIQQAKDDLEYRIMEKDNLEAEIKVMLSSPLLIYIFREW